MCSGATVIPTPHAVVVRIRGENRRKSSKMERWVAKIIALVIVFILPCFCTLLPHKVSDFVARKGEAGKKLLSCLMCFGGGVFFATYILHMGPEVRDILNKALLEPHHITYPLADLIMASGFFIVFFVEKITLKINKKRQKQKMKAKLARCVQINKLASPTDQASANPMLPKSSSPEKGQGDDCCGQCGESGGCGGNNKPNGVIPATNSVPAKKKAVSIEDLAVNLANGASCPLSGTGECCTDPEEAKSPGTEESLFMVYTPAEPEDEATTSAHNTRSLVLILALSLHRIFEGMSVGLQHTTANIWNLLIAVMCHETVIGFSMGLQFVKNGFKLRRMIVASLLCSTIMPAGVAIGTIISEVGREGNVLNILNGVLQGVATGTFIYVTFFEILQEEIDAHDTCISKVFSVFIGFAVMAALSAIPEEDETLGMPLTHENGHIVNSTMAAFTP